MKRNVWSVGFVFILTLMVPVFFGGESSSFNCSTLSVFAAGGGCDCGSPSNKTPKEYPAPKDESGGDSSARKKKITKDDGNKESNAVKEPEEKEDPDEKESDENSDDDGAAIDDSDESGSATEGKSAKKSVKKPAEEPSEEKSADSVSETANVPEKPESDATLASTKSSGSIFSCSKCGYFTNSSGGCPKCGIPLKDSK